MLHRRYRRHRRGRSSGGQADPYHAGLGNEKYARADQQPPAGPGPVPTFRTVSSKLYGAPWHEGVQKEFRKFIEEFGRRGYFADPHFMALYVHGISTSTGEEMNIDGASYTNEAKTAGLTAEVLQTCWRDRMDWWSTAAGDYAYKLIWVGSGNITGLDYDQAGLDAYALTKHMGWRAGFIENYFYTRLHPPLAGQRYEDGHVISDWHHDLHDGRYFGDEAETNEFLSVTNPDALYLVARSPYFRAAQVGLNFLWVSKNTIDWASDTTDGTGTGLPKWFTLVAGKGPSESPDAACWLREAYIRGLGSAGGLPWKNMERMIYQYDLPGATTRLDELVDGPYVQLMDRSKTYEYTARSTNVGAQQRDIAFSLDPDFRGSLVYPVQIKITFRDKTQATWTVRAATAGGTTRDLGTITGVGDGAWRTATFTLDEPFSPAALDPDPSAYPDRHIDFVVHTTDDQHGDVTVRYVRVVRLADGSNHSLGILMPPESRTAEVGDSVILRVIPSGTAPFSYQWRHGEEDIGGANSPTLTLDPVDTADDGIYTVVVTNNDGSIESDAAVLRVTRKYTSWASAFGLTGSEAAPASTPAGDGITNLAAYALGLDPRRDKTWGLPRIRIVNTSGLEPEPGEALYPAIEADRSPFAIGLGWTVETSSDLTNWFHDDTLVTLDDSRDHLLVRSAFASEEEPRRFLRLRISEVPADQPLYVETIDDFEDGPDSGWKAQVPSGSGGTGAGVSIDSGTGTAPDGSAGYGIIAFNALNSFQYASLYKTGSGIFGPAWSANQVNAFRFWIRGPLPASLAADRIKFQIREGDTGERWSYNLADQLKDDVWHLVTIPIAALTLDTAGGTATGRGGEVDVDLLDSVRIYYNSAAEGITISVDQLEALRLP